MAVFPNRESEKQEYDDIEGTENYNEFILNNMDCMDGMKQFPDKYFELAIVDPPYGINFAKTYTGKGWVVRESKDWDKQVHRSQQGASKGQE